MKREYLFATVALIAIVLIFGYQDKLISSKSKQLDDFLPASKVISTDHIEGLYKNYCFGCHNENKSPFVNRNWMFGASREDVFSSIKNGRVAHGMPAFADGFSDEVLYQFTDYVINLRQNVVEDKRGVNTTQKGLEYSKDLTFRVDTVVSGLNVPWGLEFLPNGNLLISERSGELLLYTIDNEIIEIKNVPKVLANGQGGLLDLELHPNYNENGWIYLSYSEPDIKNSKIANTSVLRARLKNDMLVDNEVIFRALPKTQRRHHYGCKLEFDKNGFLFLSVGDRGDRSKNPQTLENHSGKIHRIHDDGRIPKDNPFVKTKNAVASIYSYGHRNPQGVCMHPETGKIWTDEHGPKGGDEINIIAPGKNYGWPVISFGINYNGTTFTKDTAKVGMEMPLHYWIPSIAPCGMTFVKGDVYPAWKNNLLTGSLRYKYLHRVVLDGEKVVSEERLMEGVGRVRNVEMSPDGYIYVAIEKPGKILKLIPIQ